MRHVAMQPRHMTSGPAFSPRQVARTMRARNAPLGVGTCRLCPSKRHFPAACDDCGMGGQDRGLRVGTDVALDQTGERVLLHRQRPERAADTARPRRRRARACSSASPIRSPAPGGSALTARACARSPAADVRGRRRTRRGRRVFGEARSGRGCDHGGAGGRRPGATPWDHRTRGAAPGGRATAAPWLSLQCRSGATLRSPASMTCSPGQRSDWRA